MIEIRNKRHSFHQDIRKTQRDNIRSGLRKNLIQQLDQKQLFNSLNQAFQFFYEGERLRQNFWNEEYFGTQNQNNNVFQLIGSVCKEIKNLIGEHEKDQKKRQKIVIFLSEHLPYLIPPKSIHLEELPKAFINICLYMLKESQVESQWKQFFIENLNNQTIIYCLLSYFVQNWSEIRKNECKDLTVAFFYEINKHKNIFSKSEYFNNTHQDILTKVVQYLLKKTSSQRRIYTQLEIYTNSCDIDLDLVQKINDYSSFSQNNYSDSECFSIENLIKNSVFLGNLLLVSRIPNFKVKQLKQSLKSILYYLYRKIYLNPQHIQYKSSAQFCICILIQKTADHTAIDQVRMMQNILDTDLKQETRKYEKLQVQGENNEQVQPPFNTTDNLQQVFPTVVPSLLLSRIKLLMICTLVQQIDTIQFEHIEKWITKNMKQSQSNQMFTLQNPDLIVSFLHLLNSIIVNDSKDQYFSYSIDRLNRNNKTQKTLFTKIRIFKLLGTKGIIQLMSHQNLSLYSNQLAQLLYSMIQCIDYKKQRNYDSGFYDNQADNQDNYIDDQNDTLLLDDEYLNRFDQKRIQSQFINQLYKICKQFMRRCFKQIKFKNKQKILLSLMLNDQINFDDCCDYLTLQQRKVFYKNAVFHQGESSMSSVQTSNNSSNDDQMNKELIDVEYIHEHYIQKMQIDNVQTNYQDSFNSYNCYTHNSNKNVNEDIEI